MQKWEHMVVRSYGGVVVLIDGKEVAQMSGPQPVGEMIYEFLDRVGEDGWEVVAMGGVREGIEIILKRPFLEEEFEE
jgi:thioredoxin-like negative regulator of GroEL